MGSPVSPCVANIFMAKLEEDALKPFNAAVHLWHRYVDDVFSIVKKTQADNLLAHLNSRHPSIKFTIETERERVLPSWT